VGLNKHSKFRKVVKRNEVIIVTVAGHLVTAEKSRTVKKSASCDKNKKKRRGYVALKAVAERTFHRRSLKGPTRVRKAGKFSSN